MSDATDLEPMPMPFEPRREDAIAKNAALGLTIAPESTVRWAGDMQLQISAAKAKLAEGKKSSGKLLADAIAQATGSNSALADAPNAPDVSPADPADFDFELGDLANPASKNVGAAATAAAHDAMDNLFADFDTPPPAGQTSGQTTKAFTAPVPAETPAPATVVSPGAHDDFLGIGLGAHAKPVSQARVVPQKDAGKALSELKSFRAARKQTQQTNNEDHQS